MFILCVSTVIINFNNVLAYLSIRFGYLTNIHFLIVQKNDGFSFIDSIEEVHSHALLNDFEFRALNNIFLLLSCCFGEHLGDSITCKFEHILNLIFVFGFVRINSIEARLKYWK